MQRRHLMTTLGGALALTTALAACGGDDDSDGSTSDDGGEQVTLTVSVWNYDETPEFETLFDAFETANPGITIEHVDILADDYPEKVTTMLAGGDTTDVITMKNVIDYSRYSSRGQLADITDVVESADFAGDLSGLDAFDLDGSYYAMPYRQDFWLLYYNKRLFDEAGIDYPDNLSWDEYADLAKQLTDADNDVYGTYHHTWRSVIQAVSAAQTGGDLLGGDYTFFADQYDMAIDLQDSGASMDFGTASSQQASYRTMFETEATAMLPMGTWYINGAVTAKANGDTDVDWGIAQMPQITAGGEIQTFGSPTAFAVNENAEHSDAAKTFAEWASGPEGAAALAEIGVVPALQSADVTEAYFNVEGMPEDELSKRAFEPNAVALEMPVSDLASDIDTILNEEHELIMVGDKSVADGIQTMNDRVQSQVLE